MARRKNRPESVDEKYRLSERLRQIRVELYGERGGSEMARRLGLPVRTWYNYESGVTVPAEVLLRFMELTSAEPLWLLHGEGPRYRERPGTARPDTAQSVRDLLRIALHRLEQRDPSPQSVPPRGGGGAGVDLPDVVLLPVEAEAAPGSAASPEYVAARRDWVGAPESCRCVRVEGDAMAPILADGAYAAYSSEVEPYEALAGSLVVAWVGGRPLVRWFEPSGSLGILRAENPKAEPGTVLLNLDGPPESRRVRRVVGTSTPHR
jgi:transcriptional regulator with XRE-family HTH domain